MTDPHMTAPHMTDPAPATDPSIRRGPSRRTVLGLLGAGGLAAATGYGLLRGDGHPGAGADPGRLAGLSLTGRPTAATAAVTDRRLVVVELQGGNDGLATVVPEAGRLRDLRRGLLPDDLGLVDFVAETRLHPGLAPLRDRGLAVLQGVGASEPDGSHFEMEQRWWAGDSSRDRRAATGFLGRLCDTLAPDATVAGVSLGAGATPALLADHATTIGLPDPGAAWFLTNDDDQWYDNLRHGLRALGAADVGETRRVQRARRGLDDALAFADLLRSIDEDADRGFPESELGRQLQLAGGLLDSDIGLRVIHVPFGGFDTHDDQLGGHGRLMGELGAAVAALLDDLVLRNLADRVLIATTSEFGRRPEQNGNGTDHGTAAPALLCGPVVVGLHGDAPRLDRLDDDGNLVATAVLEDYYATLAESWLGVPADEVLAAPADPATGIIAV